ncbi:DUF397 domain-containing protein [Amycolatopsis antarctica]|uniref:DUF397 domain-containing protein n=1 Tax=Amycolatopsis antarctica TaxID=1854586 RepID=A0A263D2Z6_9PSEU|nr:DUF397 domain-containing protein [Amycolatopsis antarctica]OZM72579.1 DUF397 domain-containing protein [Amycolatopsis antarctica]
MRNGSSWRKSSHSGEESNCVEVAVAARVGVRDTKDRDGGTLTFTPDAWSAALTHLRHTPS